MSANQKVRLNLIQQEVYSRSPQILGELSGQKIAKIKQEQKKYYELINIETSDGIRQKLVEVDYPITVDSVKSYKNSTLYKEDLEGAIARGHNKPNLGDVTSMQDVIGQDYDVLKGVMDRLSQYKRYIEKQDPKQEPKQEPKVEGGVK